MSPNFERERERETDRQTDTDADRQTDRQRGREGGDYLTTEFLQYIQVIGVNLISFGIEFQISPAL